MNQNHSKQDKILANTKRDFASKLNHRKKKQNLFDSIGKRVSGALIEAFNTSPIYEV